MRTATPPARRFRHAGMVALRLILALIFLVAGVAKLSGMAFMVALFQAIGVGSWFRFTVGAIEVVGALCLLTPRLAGMAALVLSALMLGAIVTQGFIIKASPLAPLAVLVMLAVLAWNCRTATARSLARLRSALRR